MLVLGIETSCDETAAAVVRDGVQVLSSVVHSQIARHRPFGGVVPEIAAREHVINLLPVLKEAFLQAGVSLGEIEAVAVTDCPGLLPALLSGVAAGEALGLGLGVPVVGVNHIEAHLTAPFLARGERPRYPLVSLVASGGHTHLFRSGGPLDHRLLGATLDDAAGEAFDKVAKMLGLAYPGGPAIEQAARDGDPRAVAFKRSYISPSSLDFSFSGLKTAVLYRIRGQAQARRAGKVPETARPLSKARVADLAAAFQATVVDVLVTKLQRAVARTGVSLVGVGGGVACNQKLRDALQAAAGREGWELVLPPPALCTDNAAMVAARGETLLAAHPGVPPAPCVAARACWHAALP